MKNMKEYTTDSQKHQEELQEQLHEGQKIVEEIEKIKQGASGMPTDLDSDIASSIESAVESARAEARNDIQEVANEQGNTKNKIGETQAEIDTKINANDSAKGKLEGISGSYGDSQIRGAVSAIEESTQLGNEISQELQNAADEATSLLNDLENQI